MGQMACEVGRWGECVERLFEKGRRPGAGDEAAWPTLKSTQDERLDFVVSKNQVQVDRSGCVFLLFDKADDLAD